MNLQELSGILKLQAGILQASRADSSDVHDLREFATFLGKFGPISVAAFCEGYGAIPAKPKSSSKKAADKPVLSIADSSDAADYVSRLRADMLGIEGTIAAIESDSALSLPVLKLIISELIGTAAGITSKKKAIAALVSWQEKNKARGSRGENVESGF